MPPDPAKEILRRHYAMNGHHPIAFLDETYREAREHVGERPFYLFTAVIVEPADMEEIRKELPEIAASGYWHTTEALQTANGRERALEMARYLGDGTEPCVVARRLNLDPDETTEDARQRCLHALARDLTAASTPWGMTCRLLVLEQRHERAARNRDEKTFRDARTRGDVPREAKLVQTSPSVERLLWLPDLVSSAVRRQIVHGSNMLLSPLVKQLHYIEG